MSISDAQQESSPEHKGPPERLRELGDPHALRALTHPVRLALLEALTLEGPLTATEAAALIGESPTTCSFHFRQLAKYGFIEEDGGGPGRRRPWRMAQVGVRFSDVHDDPETRVAAMGLEKMLSDRSLARLQHFRDIKSTYPTEWQEAPENVEAILYVTPEELREVTESVLVILEPFLARVADPSARPVAALPVEVLLYTYPLYPPKVSS
jgi:DNA-binding transcriptional ArsR family regulator